IGGERELGDLELLVVQHPLEGRARPQHLDGQLDAVRLHPTVHERTGAIVIPACKRELEFGHRHHSASAPIPKFASFRGTLSCELRNQRSTSKYMFLVRFWI